MVVILCPCVSCFAWSVVFSISPSFDSSGRLCLGKSVPREVCASGMLCIGKSVPREGCASGRLCLGKAVPRKCCASGSLCLGKAVPGRLCLGKAVPREVCASGRLCLGKAVLIKSVALPGYPYLYYFIWCLWKAALRNCGLTCVSLYLIIIGSLLFTNGILKVL